MSGKIRITRKTYTGAASDDSLCVDQSNNLKYHSELQLACESVSVVVGKCVHPEYRSS